MLALQFSRLSKSGTGTFESISVLHLDKLNNQEIQSHIDSAQVYWNEEQVGAAVKESGISRADLFISTFIHRHFANLD